MAYIGKKPSFEHIRTDELVVRQGASIELIAGSATTNLDISEKSFVSISVSGSSSDKTIISGIVAPTAANPAKNGKIIILKNTSSTDIFLLEEDVSADAENRLITGFSKQLIVSANSTVTLNYDINLERWNVQSSSTETSSSLVVGTNDIQLDAEELDLSLMSRKTALVELTAGAVSVLKSISAGKNGELLMLVNKTGNILQISDEDVLFTAENRILTGTGAPVIIQNNASIFLAYIKDSQSISRWNIVGGTGSGGGAVEQVEQTNIGDLVTYPIGTPLYVDNSGPDYWKKASAASVNLAEVAGLISRRLADHRSEVALSGEVSGVKASVFVEGVLPDRGSVVFLSDTAGKLTVSDMTIVGYVSKPIGIVHAVNLLDASVDIMFYNQRGVVVGGVNARTQINLSGSASVPTITPIQNISEYEAGELAGWVYIDGTTNYRFYFQSQFAKNGLDTEYNIAVPQTVGDTPPVGFGVDVVDGEVKIELPAIPGFVNAYVNFALNAPAVGASLPLNINSTRVYTTYKSISGAYTLSSSDDLVVATGASAYTVTLPAAAGNTGKTYTIKCDLDAGVFLTIDVDGGGLIDSSSTKVLLKGETLQVVGDGTKWINLNSGNVYTTYKSISGAYTLSSSDNLVAATGSSAYIVTLPAAAGNTGKTYTIKCELDAGVFLTIDVDGGGLIDSSSTKVLLKGETLQVVGDGTKWINLNSGISEGRGSVPLGSIIPIGDAAAWALPATGEIKDGYALCNGQVFPAGKNPIFSGNMPDLTDERFLQGATSSGITGGSTAKTTTGVAASFNKNVMNTNQNAHFHKLPFWMYSSSDGTYSQVYGILNQKVSGQGYYGEVNIGGSSGASVMIADVVAAPSNTSVVKSSTDTISWVSSTVNTTVTQGTISDIRPQYFNVVYVMRVV